MRRNPHRVGSAPLRAARLYVRRNELRRPSERVEAVLVAILLAAFVAAVVVAALLAARVYRSEQANAAGLQPTVAVLAPHAVPTATQLLDQSGSVAASWRLADGATRSGLLNAGMVPDVDRLPPGTSVRVWLDRAGLPVPPPQSTQGMVLGAAMAGLTVVAGAVSVLVTVYLLGRRGLDRRRLANWSSAWAVTGPQWTRRPLAQVGVTARAPQTPQTPQAHRAHRAHRPLAARRLPSAWRVGLATSPKCHSFPTDRLGPINHSAT